MNRIGHNKSNIFHNQVINDNNKTVYSYKCTKCTNIIQGTSLANVWINNIWTFADNDVSPNKNELIIVHLFLDTNELPMNISWWPAMAHAPTNPRWRRRPSSRSYLSDCRRYNEENLVSLLPYTPTCLDYLPRRLLRLSLRHAEGLVTLGTSFPGKYI